MRYFVLIFLILIMTFHVAHTSNDIKTTLRLGTAILDEEYYQLGLSMKELLEQNSSIDLEVIATEGSTDNINKLINNEIDIALVQNDIAFFAENGLPPFKESKNALTGIMSIYFEPIFIVTNNPEFIHLSQLGDKKVSVGPKASGLLVDAHIILNSSNLWNSIFKYHYKADEAISKLLQNDIQFAFTNIINDSIQKNLDNKKLFIITLPIYQINNLIGTHPYFTVYNQEYDTEEITTVAVKAILICNNNIDDKLIYELTSNLYNNFSSLTIPNKDSTSIASLKNDVILSMPLQNWHKGASDFYEEIGLLASQEYIMYLWFALAIILTIIFVIISLDILIFSFNIKSINNFIINTKLLSIIKNINYLTVKYKYLLVLLTMFTVYLTCMFVVKSFEHQWAIEHNGISGFDNQSFLSNLLWLFVFGGSGYPGNLFPHSGIGKLIVTLIPFIGIGGFLAMASLFTSDHVKRKILEAKGMLKVSIQNHIIICGWNHNVPFLIKNLLHDNIANKRPIVLLAELQEEMPLEKYNLDSKMVTFIKGDSTNRDDLEKANLKDADIAIIVHDMDSSDPDAKNVLKILTIEKFGHELELNGKRKNRGNIYTIAEIQDAHVFEAAKDAYVDEIISLGHIKSKIFIQAVQNPGVCKFINEILTYNDFNDLYSISIKENSKLLGKTYDEILVVLRKYNILLLSINIENHRKKIEVERIVKQYKLTRTVLTNPIHKEENDYQTHVGDILIVLSQYEKTVTTSIKAIESGN